MSVGVFEYFCNVKTIAQHIEYLLTVHDCVVVPGLGSFMTDDESACYDCASGVYRPPVRNIGFNPEVRHNDAMLISSISRADGVTPERARKILETEVSSLNHELSISGEASLGSLGLLTKSPSSEYPGFEPFDDSLPMRRFSGLDQIAVTPLNTMTTEEVSAVPAPPAGRQLTIPMPLKIVASIAMVLVVLGILYSTTSLVKNPMLNYASLDTGLRFENVRMDVDSSDPDLESVSREIVLTIAMPPQEASQHTSHPKAQEANGGDAHYFLIVASYPTKSGAENHIRYSGDASLKIIEQSGNFRVYAASASTMEKAYSLVGSIAERYPDVWVAHN